MSKLTVVLCVWGVALAVGAVALFVQAGGYSYLTRLTGADDRSLIDEARMAVRAKLRDPNSAMFADELIVGAEPLTKTVCGTVNAKNGFGGYTGKSIFLYEQQTRAARLPDKDDDAHNIMQACREAKIVELRTRIDEVKAEIARRCSQKAYSNDPKCRELAEQTAKR